MTNSADQEAPVAEGRGRRKGMSRAPSRPNCRGWRPPEHRRQRSIAEPLHGEELIEAVGRDEIVVGHRQYVISAMIPAISMKARAGSGSTDADFGLLTADQ
ncbi:hypothetical protein [Salipiger sp.]|uniref:hypothetical protein n=1 Tax=Salipiger sp. TaxID=2078585 RepID=UPI003A96B3AA